AASVFSIHLKFIDAIRDSQIPVHIDPSGCARPQARYRANAEPSRAYRERRNAIIPLRRQLLMQTDKKGLLDLLEHRIVSYLCDGGHFPAGQGSPRRVDFINKSKSRIIDEIHWVEEYHEDLILTELEKLNQEPRGSDLVTLMEQLSQLRHQAPASS
ncbi:hypothetical protein T310_7436, partial [Rasamsonia emersonii CBS 393.64]